MGQNDQTKNVKVMCEKDFWRQMEQKRQMKLRSVQEEEIYCTLE